MRAPTRCRARAPAPTATCLAAVRCLGDGGGSPPHPPGIGAGRPRDGPARGAGAAVAHWCGTTSATRSGRSPGFVRRELARRGVALILGFGDPIDVYANGDDGGPSKPRSLGGLRGRQPVGVELDRDRRASARRSGGADARGCPRAVPWRRVPPQRCRAPARRGPRSTRGRRMVDRLADSSTWADRLDVLDHELAGSGPLWLVRLLPRVRPHAARPRSSGCAASSRPRGDGRGWSRCWTKRGGAAGT